MHPKQELADDIQEARPLMEKKTWAEFYKTGFLMYINQILHLFGWAITYSYNDDGTVAEVYPARVRFRGFTEDVVENNYRKMSQYMKNNADALLEEASE